MLKLTEVTIPPETVFSIFHAYTFEPQPTYSQSCPFRVTNNGPPLAVLPHTSSAPSLRPSLARSAYTDGSAELSFITGTYTTSSSVLLVLLSSMVGIPLI